MDVRRLTVSVCLAVGLMGTNSAVALQDATPAGAPMGGPPLPEGCTVVADGLINPRYVTVDEDGNIFVSEAGSGGDEVVQPPASSPEASASPVTEASAPEEPVFGAGARGMTGQVTMVSPDGEQTVIASGLPSYVMGGVEVTGPADLIANDDAVILAIGGAGPASAFTDPLPNENSVVLIDPATGTVTQLADIATLERQNNPDGLNIDSNLYGVELGDDGYIYVNDAGGNTTYRLPNGGGAVELVAVHPGIEIPASEAPPGGNPNRGGELALDPVPTDIESGSDGTMLVGLLSGAPFPVGGAKIVNVTPEGAVSDVASGLTMVVGLASGPDGHLYASQFSMNMLAEVPEPGSVVRVLEDGTHEVVVDGLMLPNGITFDNDGNLLVVTNAVSMGGPTGQVLRCEGITTMSQAEAPAAEVVTITLDDMFYAPASLTIPANTDVTIRLVNEGFASHDLSIGGTSFRSTRLAGGTEAEFTLNLPPGDYAFGCDVPGHRLAGMTGVLHVE